MDNRVQLGEGYPILFIECGLFPFVIISGRHQVGEVLIGVFFAGYGVVATASIAFAIGKRGS